MSPNQTPTARQICTGLVNAQFQAQQHAIWLRTAQGIDADVIGRSANAWIQIRADLQAALARNCAANDSLLGVM
ncbi:hypothetical protein [Curvibacter lanceolatus]|uniref:hypothetical protein n=1 Tax=Curvibacter lanceolatus TaxID=86182 RepID=UPI0003797C8D|nr:hypothetical protein [Curvibacter lanceolatus]